MNITLIRTISMCWIVIFLAFAAGVYVHATKTWPYPLIDTIQQFIAGESMEDKSLAEKILHDLDIRPTRHLVGSDVKTSVIGEHRELTDLPIQPRRQNPTVFLSDRAPKGFRVIYGVFDFKDTRCGVIILDSEGNVAKVWHVSQEDVDWEHRPDANVYPHGFEIAPNGAILTGYDSGSSLTKYDYCNNIIWRLEGTHHHSIDFEDEDTFWTWGPHGDMMLKVCFHTGDILKEMTIMEVMRANPDIDIFGIRQRDDDLERPEWVLDGGGPFHANDVEALPKELDKYYPMFSAGDLLVTLRSPNLVFVMDQATLQVKWWRQGLARRPHDADWNDRGTITIFNNNMHRKPSNILEIDPATFQHKVLVDGAHYDFYTANRGKHQILPDGGVLITSSRQGRVFEVDGDGNIVFEFINTFDKTSNLMISEAKFIPEDFFKELPKCNP